MSVDDFGHADPPTFDHPNTHDGDLDVREWRVGNYTDDVKKGDGTFEHEPNRLSEYYVCAVNPDPKVGALDCHLLFWIPGHPKHARALAEQIVREHAMLSAPYADDDHRGGHWLNILPQRPRWATLGETAKEVGENLDGDEAVRALREAHEYAADGFPRFASHIQDRLDIVQAAIDGLRPKSPGSTT